jgi:HlyD family secretion protein
VAPAGGRILVVAYTQKYWVKIYMPQSLINRIEMGREAQIKLEGVEDTIKGTIGYISPFVEFTPRAVQTTMERASQTFAVKVYFETLPKTLRPGSTADVIFEGL